MLPSLRRRNPRKTLSLGFVIVADPGPDPDDVKAILVAAIMHRLGRISVRAVIANGGRQARKRARLARCVLDHVGVYDVPVGEGSQGKPYTAQKHEYNIGGFDAVDDSRLHCGADLLLQTLEEAAPKSITFVLISSLRDVADLVASHADLFIEKVAAVTVMGGLVPDDRRSGRWVPDEAVNNGFDPEAAAQVYDFCFDRGVQMTVVSRHAVPMLPMQLARSFAERQHCEVIRYLADAQNLGLEGLWVQLCRGSLPSRCTKQWYFETFCGVDASTFEDNGYDALDESVEIMQHLNGYVKPYDVVALMTALPGTSDLFALSEIYEVGGVQHRLLLNKAQELKIHHVHTLLREVYHEVVLASNEVQGPPVSDTSPVARADRGGAQPRLARRSHSGPRRPGFAGPGSRRDSGSPTPGSVGNGSPTADAVSTPSPVGTPVRRTTTVPSTLRLRSSNCRSMLGFVSAADGNVGGDEGAKLMSLRKKSFSVDFNRKMEANVVNRLQKALDEARTHQVRVSRNIGVVSAAVSLLTAAGLVSDVNAADGASLLLNSAPAGGALERTAWRHALCLLLLLLSLPAIVLSVQPRRLRMGNTRLLAVAATVASLAMACVNALRAAGLLEDLGVQSTACDGVADLSMCDLEAAAAAAAFDTANAAVDTAAAAFNTAATAVAGADVAEGNARAAVSAEAFPPSAARRLLLLLWLGHCGPVHALSAGALGVTSAWLGAHLRSHWAHGPRLLDITWAAVGVLSLCAGATTLGCRSALRDAAGSCTLGRGVDAAALIAGVGATGLGAALLRGASRRRMRAALARATGSMGTYAPLAPLIGYGCASTGDVEPDALYAEAMRTFVTLELSKSVRDRLGDILSPEGWAERCAAAAAGRPDGGANQGPGEGNQAEAREVRARSRPQTIGEEGPDGSGGAHRNGGHSDEGRREEGRGPHSRPSVSLCEGDGDCEASRCLAQGQGQGAVADYYVCHSWEDNAEAKVAALQRWAERREAELGAPPTVWMDAFCAQKSLAPHQLLQYMPVYLTKSSKLLLLCGPTVVDRLWCVMELFCWLAMGGKQEDVDVVLVTPPGDSAELEQVVAAFDAFHVMYCKATLEEDQMRMEYAVELATIPRFNERIRSYYPIVLVAVQAERAALAKLSPGGDSAHGTEPVDRLPAASLAHS